MLVRLGILLCAVVLLAAQAQAQQTADPTLARTDCDCPDIDVVIILDREIASIEQKMIRLGQGLTDDESGLPNNPVLLLAIRDETRMMREAYVRDITSCRRMCRRYPDANPTDPRSAFSGASAACSRCTIADNRLSAAETALSNMLNEIENFRRHNRVRDRGGVNSADFTERRSIYENALARYETARQRHAELEAAAEAAHARVGSRAILRDWQNEDGSATAFDAIGAMTHSFASAGGALFDYIVQTGRNDGLPIPDQAYVSRLGAAWSADRHARQYYLDHVEPAASALTSARLRLPDMERSRGADADEYPGSEHWDNVLDRLAQYESDLQPLITDRDAALGALVACNVRLCRPAADISDLWGPDGLFTPASLEDRFPNLPPSADQAPDNSEGLLTGDTFEAPDLSGGPEPADSGEGLGLPDNPEGAVPATLDTPWIPQAPELPPDVIAALQAAQARQPVISGPCDISPDLVCRHLADAEREACDNEISELRGQCVDFQANAFVSMGRVDTCRRSCQYSERSTNTQFWLLDRVIETLQSRFDEIVAERDEREARAAQRLQSLPAEILALENLRDERRIHIYRNINSGALVQHADAYFEPQPPLEYVGNMAGRLDDTERDELSRLSGELAFTEALLATIPSREAYEDWFRPVLASWTGGQGHAPMMACSSASVPDLSRQCLQTCEEEGEATAGVKSICQPAGVIGRLSLPSTPAQLLPPIIP